MSNKDNNNKTNNKKEKKMIKVPKNDSSSQMDMFKSFVAPNNDDSILSNLVRVWDLTPKYIVSRRDKYRHERLENIKNKKEQIVIDNDVIDVEITPALIEENDKLVAYFPSESEEIIEHVMRKILLEQRFGIHSNKPHSTWVKYTVRMVQKELKKLKKSRSHKEIIKSIEILSRCHVKIKKNGQVIQSGAIFKESLDASNQDFSNELETLKAIQLPEIITSSINKLEFRQYNYLLTNSLKTQLSRWLMRRLSLFFINAGGLIQQYEIKYSDICKDSCLLSKNNHRLNRVKIEKAIKELVEQEVLYFSENENNNKIVEYSENGQTIANVTYFLHPALSFVKHMKASNLRNKNIKN